jgi:D-tyrosyl-tRNA(Tyr) deacylase
MLLMFQEVEKSQLCKKAAQMRVVIQRVSEASILANGISRGAIGTGLLVLLGIEHSDTKQDVDWLVRKIVAMRIFSDVDGKMNLSVSDINGDVAIVSQFTLFASTKKGNRPGFTNAASPDIAIPLYVYFLQQMEVVLGKQVKSGVFGADMKIHLVNDGPVTILIDSRLPE